MVIFNSYVKLPEGKQEKYLMSAVQATTKSGFFVNHHRNQQQEQVDLSEIEQPKQNWSLRRPTNLGILL